MYEPNRTLSKLTLFIFLLGRSFDACAQVVPIQTLDISKYAPGTFFSVVFDKNNPSTAFAAPSEGAVYADGRPVEKSNMIDHYGGHVQVRAGAYKQMSIRQKFSADFAGGGFKIGENGELKFSYTSRSMNGGDGSLTPALRTTIERTVTDNIGKGFSSRVSSFKALTGGSANCLKGGLGAAGNVLGIIEMVSDAYLNAKHEQEFELLKSSPCPPAPAERSDIYWNNFYSEDSEVTADRIKKCSYENARDVRYASEDYRVRLYNKLKSRFEHPTVICNGGKGTALKSIDGIYSFSQNANSSPSILFTNTQGDTAVSIDAKNVVSYKFGTSTWSEPMEQFEKRVACQSDPPSCPRNAALPMFDDQIGTDVSHPFGAYYDGGQMTQAYLKLKNFYLLKQVDSQINQRAFDCYEMRAIFN